MVLQSLLSEGRVATRKKRLSNKPRIGVRRVHTAVGSKHDTCIEALNFAKAGTGWFES